MHPAHTIVIALAMGIVTVDLFSRAWMGLMGIIAALVLNFRGELSRGQFIRRINLRLVNLLFCGGLLVVLFHLYSSVYALGTSQGESLAYLISAGTRLIFFLTDISKQIDDLLSSEHGKG